MNEVNKITWGLVCERGLLLKGCNIIGNKKESKRLALVQAFLILGQSNSRFLTNCQLLRFPKTPLNFRIK
jgi:hypothetical protein